MNEFSIFGETEYLFIDGAYLRQRYKDVIAPIFGVDIELSDVDFERVRAWAKATKVFYYDCLDDKLKDSETQSQLDARIEKQENTFNKIRSLDGLHVILGSVTGRNRKTRQKKVDVQLAVDMLSHAFHRNMKRASLLAGDQDFQPVVQSLIYHGTFVRVLYDKKSASSELYWSADSNQVIGLQEYLQWLSESFRTGNPFPEFRREIPVPYLDLTNIQAKGSVAGVPFSLHRYNKEFYLYSRYFSGMNFFHMKGPNLEVLQRFFKAQFGHSFERDPT